MGYADLHQACGKDNGQTAMGIEIIRFGELEASNYTLGPWATTPADTSAQGVRYLLAQNPFIKPSTPVYAALQGKSGVAAYCYFYPDCLKTPTTRHAWLWMTDFMTLPEYRRSGAGMLLIREVIKQLHAEAFTLGGIHMSADSKRVFKALKFPVMTEIPRFLAPLRSRPIFKSMLPSPLAVSLSIITDPCLKVYWKTKCKRLAPRAAPNAIMPTDAWPPPPDHASVFIKNTDIIKWKRAIPGGQRTFDQLQIRTSSAPTPAHALIRYKHVNSIAGGRFRDVNIASVLEAAGDSPKSIVGSIMAHVIHMPKMDVLEWCEGRPEFQQALSQAGFHQKGSLSFCASQPIDGNLHFMQGDGDAFF